ncbi:MAG TPA: Asp23/Gls24 family envelope stress response protein [Trueperaceae bacterium]|nr:Asp23/Gls24 family envelope stress response protein [Trueperaceae bacterium]
MTGEEGLDISTDVLYGIAQLAIDQVEGIRTVQPPARVGEILTGRRAKGIAIERADDGLRMALTVRVDYGVEVPKVAAAAQKAVREAVASMTGMNVVSVDVTVEDVDLTGPHAS